jgi:hypothetical protein
LLAIWLMVSSAVSQTPTTRAETVRTVEAKGAGTLAAAVPALDEFECPSAKAGIFWKQ